MVPFQKYSIRQKLMAMSLWASSGALLLATTAFMTYDFFAYRASLVKGLSALSEIISYNAASAVVFNDSASATKTLASLRARPTILSASIYTLSGDVFAHWARDPHVLLPSPSLPPAGKETHEFDRNSLILFHPMILDNSLIGTVYIQSDLTDLTARLKRYTWIAILVLSISLCTAVIIALKVGERISQPILHLVQVAKTVSDQKDYSVRAVGTSQDELGLLIKTFNAMLTKLQEDGEALQQAHEKLEQRVQERTAQLTAANNELEAFSYSVSHDLRTPLRAIDGFSRELLSNSNDRLDDQGKADLHRILAATVRMSQLIDDLLKLSRVTRSEMQRQEVDLSAIVVGILENLKMTQPDRQVESRITPNLMAMGDAPLLRVALENLVGNAWKFTGKQPDAKIEFGALEQDGKTVFFVRDNGAGFNMAHVAKLFGVFQRLHDTSDYPGTGVGLATVQRIINRHGGRIWVEAAVHQGATFYFTLS